MVYSSSSHTFLCVSVLGMGMPKENEKYSRRNQCPPPHFLMCPSIGYVSDLLPPQPVVSIRRKSRAKPKLSRARQCPATSQGHHVGHQDHRPPCPPEELMGVAGAALPTWSPFAQVPRNLAVIPSQLLVSPHHPIFSLPPKY